MSAKSNKIELNEEFMVMSKEEQPPEVFCKKLDAKDSFGYNKEIERTGKTFSTI